jgi:hypothetical protein
LIDPTNWPFVGFERVDDAVAEVTDQQPVGEMSEARRRQRHAPGRVERAAGDDATDQVAVDVEHVDVAESRAGNVVLGICVLLGEGDIDAAEDVSGCRRVRSAAGIVGSRKPPFTSTSSK